MKKIKELYLKYKELINYLIFGVVSLVTFYLARILLLTNDTQLDIQISNIISWFFAVLFAFATNKKYVFAPTNKSIIKEMIEFYSSRLLSLFIDMGLMFLLVSTLHFNDKIVKIIIQIIIIIFTNRCSRVIIIKDR